jgi:hypothetical protein
MYADTDGVSIRRYNGDVQWDTDGYQQGRRSSLQTLPCNTPFRVSSVNTCSGCRCVAPWCAVSSGNAIASHGAGGSTLHNATSRDVRRVRTSISRREHGCECEFEREYPPRCFSYRGYKSEAQSRVRQPCPSPAPRDEHSNVRSWTLLLPATRVTSRVRKIWHAIGHPTLHKHL